MIGFWDTIFRILVGFIFIWLGIEKGGIFEITKFVGIVLTLTAIFSYCPIYKLADVSTKCTQCNPIK